VDVEERPVTTCTRGSTTTCGTPPTAPTACWPVRRIPVAQRLDPYTVKRVLDLPPLPRRDLCRHRQQRREPELAQAADQLVVTTVPREDAAFTADWMLDLLDEAGMDDSATTSPWNAAPASGGARLPPHRQHDHRRPGVPRRRGPNDRRQGVDLARPRPRNGVVPAHLPSGLQDRLRSPSLPGSRSAPVRPTEDGRPSLFSFRRYSCDM
jgi:hypothetical protein